jgi:hypothetical protein
MSYTSPEYRTRRIRRVLDGLYIATDARFTNDGHPQKILLQRSLILSLRLQHLCAVPLAADWATRRSTALLGYAAHVAREIGTQKERASRLMLWKSATVESASRAGLVLEHKLSMH